METNHAATSEKQAKGVAKKHGHNHVNYNQSNKRIAKELGINAPEGEHGRMRPDSVTSHIDPKTGKTTSISINEARSPSQSMDDQIKKAKAMAKAFQDVNDNIKVEINVVSCI